MYKRIKKMWTDALRSGEFEQGTNNLADTERKKFCCLGVLCELAVREGVIPAPHIRNNMGKEYMTYGLDSYTLPSEVMLWAGLKEANPTIKRGDTSFTLAAYNDGYEIGPISLKACDFNYIADTIDEEIEAEEGEASS
jgi:hypothetical protein